MQSRQNTDKTLRLALPTCAALLALALGACGGGGGSSSDSAAPQPAAVVNPTDAPVLASASTPDYVPLYGADTQVMEQIQYREADGTLVTLAGFRPTNRHARERGEPWDAAADVGPGNYFTFPTWYFQNRTYGLMIRDEIPAGRSRIEISLRVNNGTFINSGLSAFRRVDADVRDYGWKMNVGFENPTQANKNVCYSTSAREDCMDVITDNWRAPQPGTPLQIGDHLEITPAAFLDNTDGFHALIDGGGIRYYSFEQLYVVGKGMVPWYGVAPSLDSYPLPDAALSGGQASVSYNYSEEPHRVFQQTVNNIGIADMQRFVEGRRLFHTSFVDGTHSESPTINPVFSAHANQLGPRFNNIRCIACHTLDGRSEAPVLGKPLTTMNIITALSSSASGIQPDPVYGLDVLQQAQDAAAPDYSVTVQSYTNSSVTLAGGEVVQLQKPVYAFKGPVPAQFSVRQAPQLTGMGLLEAIDESTILSLADPTDKDGDGVHGVPNWVIDPETGVRHLGRFGWKASKGSLRQQSGDALLKDMGVTSPVFKSRDCQRGVTNCNANATTTAISDADIKTLANYLALLGVPAQRSLRSGYMTGVRVSPEHDVNPTAIQHGASLFAQAKCTACHIAQLQTGAHHPFAELRNQTIHPYTDLLLHDMGSGLADTITEGQAQPAMWRTQPLWGLGALPYVQKTAAEAAGPDTAPGPQSNARYLHDGRARTLVEAIMWHGGEATNSKNSFAALSATDRADLLTFLSSL